MIYSLPMSLAVGGADHAIRSDYRVILDLIEVLNDPDFLMRTRRRRQYRRFSPIGKN